jgi:ABC-type nitrate/sulfonate/bicarbonate transport system substrate-binding protein
MQRSRWLGVLAALATLVAFSPLLATASPDAQKGLRTIRFITFSIEPATLVAQARGFLAAEGLDIDVTITPNSTDQMRGLGQGTWDIASTGFDNVLAWSARDGGPQIVGVLQPSTSINLPMYVRPEIQTWEDLRGKPLAVDAVDTAFALVLRLESMARGDTHAGIMSTDLEARAQAAGLRRMTDHREVLPDYAPGVFAVTRPWAQQNGDTVRRFLRAWLAAARWIDANPEATIEMVMAARNTTRAAATQIVEERSRDGAMNVAGLGNVLELRTLFGYPLPMGNDLARFLDDSYYRQVMGR